MTEKTAKISNPELIKFLETNFKNLNRGVNSSLLWFMELYKQALWNLKGKFSDIELKAIINAMNGTMIDKLYIKANILTAMIQDADQLEGLGVKWNIATKALADKINNLNTLDHFFLALWTNSYWHGKKKKLGKYINVLV